MAICNDGVAMKAGTNAGIIANLLMGLMEEGDAVEKFGRTWCRCSFKSITVIYPFLSMAQVEYAIGQLRDKDIIISSSRNNALYAVKSSGPAVLIQSAALMSAESSE